MGGYLLNIEQWIEHYVPIVNAEYGRSDRNAESIDYFKKLIGIAEFVVNNDYYLVYIVAPDMWGDLTLYLVSFYIMPDKRKAVFLRKLFSLIERLAKKNKVKYIVAGSHLNTKFHNFLLLTGYHQATFRKEI